MEEGFAASVERYDDEGDEDENNNAPLPEIDVEKGRRLGIFSFPPPERCDMCGVSLEGEKYFVDGARQDRSWANMCIQCHERVGTGIGWGKGQMYARQPNGMWLLVAGFAPDEE